MNYRERYILRALAVVRQSNNIPEDAYLAMGEWDGGEWTSETYPVEMFNALHRAAEVIRKRQEEENG